MIELAIELTIGVAITEDEGKRSIVMMAEKCIMAEQDLGWMWWVLMWQELCKGKRAPRTPPKGFILRKVT